MCEPEEEEEVESGPSLKGASKRARAGKVESAPPPCGEGLVCKEVQFRKYVCTEEIAGGEWRVLGQIQVFGVSSHCTAVCRDGSRILKGGGGYNFTSTPAVRIVP